MPETMAAAYPLGRFLLIATALRDSVDFNLGFILAGFNAAQREKFLGALACV